MTASEQNLQPSKWRAPLTDEQLIVTLGALAGVAAGDADNDFATAMDIYQDRERGAGRAGLSVPEAAYLAQVVRDSLQDGPHRSGLWRDNALFINSYLFKLRPSGFGTEETARRVLPDLLRAAAQYVADGQCQPDGQSTALADADCASAATPGSSTTQKPDDSAEAGLS